MIKAVIRGYRRVISLEGEPGALNSLENIIAVEKGENKRESEHGYTRNDKAVFNPDFAVFRHILALIYRL